MEAFNIVSTKFGEQMQINALQRDANTANGIPAGDAPANKPLGDSKKDKGVKLLAAAQKELNMDRMKRFRVPIDNNGNGN